MLELLPVALIFLLAGAVQGFTGFGGGLVSMALLPLLWSVKASVAVVGIFSLALTSGLAWTWRSHIDKKELLPIASTAILGVPLGVWSLHKMNETVVIGILGAVLVAHATWSLWGRPPADEPSVSRKWGPLAGFLGGILSGAFNTSGPPVIIYGTERGWVKDRFRATLQGYFLLTTVLSTTGYVTTGIITAESLKQNAMLLPALILGAWAGQRASRFVNPETFRKLVLWALLGMGVFYGVRFFTS